MEDPIIWLGGPIADTLTTSLDQYDGTPIPVFNSETEAARFVADYWEAKWYSADYFAPIARNATSNPDGSAIPVFSFLAEARIFLAGKPANYAADYVVSGLVSRVARKRLPESALDLTELAADLTALRDAMAATTVSFANAWPEDTENVRVAVGNCLIDVDAALDDAEAGMAAASLVANVVPGRSGLALAAAFQRFKILSDEAPVLKDTYSMLARMQYNIGTGDTTCSDATYPLSAPSTVAATRLRASIYDLKT